MKRLVAVVALVLAVAAPALAQCVMCKTALTSSPEGQAIGVQFNRAILLMLFAPYVVAGAFAVTLFRHRIAVALRRLVRHGH